MAHTLIRLFREIGQAQHARLALLADGFASEQVQLDVSEDEAGPAVNNFVLTSKDTGDPAQSGLDAASGTDPDRPGRPNITNSQALLRGHYILMINAGDGEQLDHAARIVQRYGAEEVGPGAPSH